MPRQHKGHDRGNYLTIVITTVYRSFTWCLLFLELKLVYYSEIIYYAMHLYPLVRGRQEVICRKERPRKVNNVKEPGNGYIMQAWLLWMQATVVVWETRNVTAAHIKALGDGTIHKQTFVALHRQGTQVREAGRTEHHDRATGRPVEFL